MSVFSKKNKIACPAKLWRSRGMSLVEVVIASAVILLLSTVLISANMTYLKTANINQKTIKAAYLIEEGIEAVNFIKNNNWEDLGDVGTDYYLLWDGTAWTASTDPSVIDGIYIRKFFTESVNRDSTDDIVMSGGALDENTRKLTVAVSWADTFSTTTKSISAYLIKNND